MSLKNVIKNAFLGVTYSFTPEQFKKAIISDELDEGQLKMMWVLMNEQKAKMVEFMKIIDVELELIKNKKKNG